MKVIEFNINLETYHSGIAVYGYTIDSNTVEWIIYDILNEFFDGNINFDIQEFDILKITNYIMPAYEKLKLNNLIRINNYDTFIEFMSIHYDNSRLESIVKTRLTKAFPCNILDANIIDKKC